MSGDLELDFSDVESHGDDDEGQDEIAEHATEDRDDDGN